MNTTIDKAFKKAAYTLVTGLLVLAAAPSQATIPVADSPLFLTVVVPPNITLTLDDSLSMAAAFVPELCNFANDCGALDNRYAKSSHHNLLYYDPTVRYPAPKNADGSPLSTSFTNAHTNGFDAGGALGSRDLSKNYRPSAYVQLGYPSDNSASEGFMGHYDDDVRCSDSANRCEVRDHSGSWFRGNQSCTRDYQCVDRGVPAYYYKYDAGNGGCNGSATDNDCYDLVVVSATSGPGTVDYDEDGDLDTDERQNFANWYSFARTRTFATQTAASLAFVDLPETTRVAWQALNSCHGSSSSFVDSNCDGWKGNLGFSNRINNFSGTHKTRFYRWLFQQPTIPNTPLRQATQRVGQYYRTSGENSPYDNDFSSNNSGELACRRNYHVLMTDGLWREDSVSPAPSNADGNTMELGDDINGSDDYSPRAPYRDNHSNTLADVAFYYWANDLRLTLDNNLLPIYRDTNGTPAANAWNPRNDPATWQHMVNFTIGLGLSGFLSEVGLTWNGKMYEGSYPSIANGTTNWPQPGDNRPENVADLWHAAINSRGQFFSADNPTSLSTAFRAALTAITDDSGSAAALSANSTSLQVGTTVVYQARFNARDWSGALVAVPIGNGGAIQAPAWDASTLIPAHGNRKIFTHNGATGSGPKGVEFSDCSALSAAQQDALNTDGSGNNDGQCDARISWLRGDPSAEERNGGSFRDRPRTVMGDVINSDPAYVKNVDYGYSGLPAGTPGQSSYASFVSGNASRTAMVYVGANDGRLYGIDAASGVESFSYIPLGVYPNLSNLTDPSYSHRYYVDGAVAAGDAYLGSSWKTVILGGLHAGGRTIYALDVTDPDSFEASNVMWEYQDTDLGYTFSQPQIAILESGQWVAIFGNGYNSPNGGAYLYVVDLATGSLISKLRAADQANVDENNGISTPVLFDEDGNRLIDTVYAGDLLGNLWKFDLSNTDPTNWSIAYGAPLFQARNSSGQVQPITAQPLVAGHPDGGQLILFGTGKYLSTDDVSDTTVQTFYGIWDDGEAIDSTDRSELQRQQFDILNDSSGRPLRLSTGNLVDWENKKGWYLDMLRPPPPGAAIGERVVSAPILKDGRAIFVSVIPSTDPCTPGGDSWLTELDFITGSAPAECALDINGDGDFNDEDEISDRCPSSIELTVGISKTPVWLDPGDTDGDGEIDEDDLGTPLKILTGTSGGFETVAQRPPATPPTITPGTTTRRSWIQIR